MIVADPTRQDEGVDIGRGQSGSRRYDELEDLAGRAWSQQATDL